MSALFVSFVYHGRKYRGYWNVHNKVKVSDINGKTDIITLGQCFSMWYFEENEQTYQRWIDQTKKKCCILTRIVNNVSTIDGSLCRSLLQTL